MRHSPYIAPHYRWLIFMLGVVLLGFGSALYSPQAKAQCAAGVDTDGDGFNDDVECAGITTIGLRDVNGAPIVDANAVPIGQRFFPRCAVGVSATDRLNCVDPASKDLFVIYVPTASGSFLTGAAVQGVNTAIPNPFAAQTVYGTAYNGFTGLGVTVHIVTVNEVPLATRQVVFGTAVTQKAVAIFEDLDATDLNTLGYCPWGRPNVANQGQCIVYTQRIWNSIPLACGTNPIVTPAGVASTAEEAFKAYTLELILHEVGHSVGGLAPTFNSSYGGYHYAPGTVMEQYVVATVSKGKCKFAVSKAFNSRNDPPAVNLK